MARPAGACRSFRDDETGALTVDWVAVTAGVLLLGVVVVYSVFNNGVSPLTASIGVALAGALDREVSDSESSDDGERTGNASDRACARTATWVVCMGPI